MWSTLPLGGFPSHRQAVSLQVIKSRDVLHCWATWTRTSLRHVGRMAAQRANNPLRSASTHCLARSRTSGSYSHGVVHNPLIVMAQYKVFIGSGDKFLVRIDTLLYVVCFECVYACLFNPCFQIIDSEREMIDFTPHVKFFHYFGRHNLTCRKTCSSQKKDKEIIIPAGQRPVAMKNDAQRCKRVCGIFDQPEFSKCVSCLSKNEQTNKKRLKQAKRLSVSYEHLVSQGHSSITNSCCTAYRLVAFSAHCTAVSCHTS